MKECFQQEMNIADEIQANDTYSNVKILFKKFGSKKIKKNIPQRLKEVLLFKKKAIFELLIFINFFRFQQVIPILR